MDPVEKTKYTSSSLTEPIIASYADVIWWGGMLDKPTKRLLTEARQLPVANMCHALRDSRQRENVIQVLIRSSQFILLL